jgi:hypothetical protein
LRAERPRALDGGARRVSTGPCNTCDLGAQRSASSDPHRGPRRHPFAPLAAAALPRSRRGSAPARFARSVAELEAPNRGRSAEFGCDDAALAHRTLAGAGPCRDLVVNSTMAPRAHRS